MTGRSPSSLFRFPVEGSVVRSHCWNDTATVSFSSGVKRLVGGYWSSTLSQIVGHPSLLNASAYNFLISAQSVSFPISLTRDGEVLRLKLLRAV